MTDVLALTRALVDIESVSGNEAGVATYLFDRVSALAVAHGGRVERIPVDGERFNVFASWGDPIVTLSTHMDTVPPFFPSREDDEFLWGRGACDAKGAGKAREELGFCSLWARRSTALARKPQRSRLAARVT
jgi:acetylornithine deacetylase